MLVHLLSVAAFVAVTFAAQGTSHFVINKEHYAQFSHLREDQIITLGLLAMIIHGALMSVALQAWRGTEVTIVDGLWVALAFGAFLVSYVALVEPAKYTVASVVAWIRVEALVGAIQFTVFGILLGWLHTKLS